MSGAGRSTAAAALEDWAGSSSTTCPPALIMKMVEMVGRPGSEHRAGGAGDRPGRERLGTGVLRRPARGSRRAAAAQPGSGSCSSTPPDDVLVRRFEGTRRRHPLAGARGGGVDRRRAQALLEPVRERADLVIDTGELNSNQLRSRILEAFGDERGRRSMQTSVVSFGYKHGIPLDVDLVFDCRFLPNPFWVEDLRPFSGLDEPVRDYVLGQPETMAFLDKVDDLLTSILPAFVREGKSYLTIAMGCTGGRHRSVALAEELARAADAHGQPVSVFHRDIDR